MRFVVFKKTAQRLACIRFLSILMNFLSSHDVIFIRAQQHPDIFLLAILILGVKVAQNKGMFESHRHLAIFHLHLTSLLLNRFSTSPRAAGFPLPSFPPFGLELCSFSRIGSLSLHL